VASTVAKPRPKHLNLLQIRLPIAGIVSIMHRVSGAVLFLMLPLLLWLSFVYLICTLGLGLLVSTLSNTQQQAMMTTVFFFLAPMIFLSGFIFPIENMPGVVQSLTYLIPLRYYLVIVRGIFLKGVGIDVLWPDALAMLGWGLVVLGLAVARSRKRLD